MSLVRSRPSRWKDPRVRACARRCNGGDRGAPPTARASLKVRDYLAAGVPVVSGHDDVFPDDFPYYRRTGTDIEAILAAAHEWRSVDRATVREAARPHIDKVELVQRLHGELVAAFASADN